MSMEKIYGFEPIIDKGCEVLILGSMPSVKSRENNFYYSNPTNRFWKIMSAIYGEDFEGMNYEQRAAALLRNKVALYDVYSSCEMKKAGSSLDSDIRKCEMNDIPRLTENTCIRKIFVTSKKAYKSFVKKFGAEFDRRGIEVVSLPSPSSANRKKFKTDQALIDEWKRLMK